MHYSLDFFSEELHLKNMFLQFQSKNVEEFFESNFNLISKFSSDKENIPEITPRRKVKP